MEYIKPCLFLVLFGDCVGEVREWTTPPMFDNNDVMVRRGLLLHLCAFHAAELETYLSRDKDDNDSVCDR